MSDFINKLKLRVLQTFILVVPLIHSPYKPDRMAQEDYFKYLGMCLVSFFTGSIWLSLFMCLNVFLFIYHGEQVGLSQILNIFIGLCIFMASKAFFTNNKLESIKTPLIILALINILFMVFQGFHIDPLFASQDASGVENNSPCQITGIFGIKMANGSFLSLVSILLMSNPIVSILMVIPILLSQSSSVIMGYAAWVSFWVYFKLKRFFILVTTILAILGVLFVVYDYKRDSNTFNSRFPVWHSCLKTSLLYPLGYGPDSYRKINKHKKFLFAGDGNYHHAIITPTGQDSQDFQFYSATNDTSQVEKLTLEANKRGNLERNGLVEWDNPHNAFLNILFQYGLGGLIILIGLTREIILRFKYSIKDDEIIILMGCLLYLSIASLSNFPIDLARVGYLLPVILGAFYARTKPV